MDIPSQEPLRDLLSQCQFHRMERSTISNGAIEWVRSTSIDTYYIECERQLAAFLQLHQEEERN
eukprot:742556-Pleurochrysis_carterae.AAC.1